MADASYVQSSFIGGEWSKLAQGRYHDQAYRKAMNVCLNGIPIESEAWVRRPGFGFAATTRSGAPGRVIPFNFAQNSPYTMEFTDGHLRFFAGKSIATLNDSVGVTAITVANPAVVQLSAARPWVTGDQVFFTQLAASCPLLQNRVFTATVIDTTHVSLTDAITGATIDGSTLGVGALAPTATISRARDVVTPYVGGSWAAIRSVQAETISFLLQSTIQPYAVNVVTPPVGNNFASIQFAPATFNDGPYLDPVLHGATITPSGVNGLITLTVTFTTYDATKAYARGDLVLFSGLNYQSLIDANLNNTPNISPLAWTAVSAGIAVGPQGFVGTDVGRLVRLFSEPALWTVGTAYVIGNVVSFIDTTGNTAYYTCLANNTAAATNAPGVSLTTWGIYTAGAIWSWGKITGLSSQISQTIAGATNIGDMVNEAGLAAAFDGVTVQDKAHSAGKDFAISAPSPIFTSAYIGRNYTGAAAQRILSGTLYPASDIGFIVNNASSNPISVTLDHITINLRAKLTAPANAADGTLLGTTTITANTTQAVSINSTDTITAYNYVWFEIITQINATLANVTVSAAECQFFSAAGGGSSGVTLQVLGPPLLYTIPVRTWRLGLYSNTTGWPTCGTYSDGRVWLSGAVDNRIDSCVSNGITNDGINGVQVNFSPTDKFGNVLASSGISYVFDADDVNPIFWMIQELQGIVCGTKSGEWVVQAPTTGGITPLNISARRMTRVGCANIEPRRTEHTTVFVQKFGRKVIEYFPDVFSGKFTAPNLSALAKHLTIGGIQEIAYQQELVPTIWARVNGTLIGCTYKRDTLMTSQGPTMMGWHRSTLGSGRVVESLAVGSSVGGNLDALTIVTNDPATNIRHVEVLGDILDEGSSLSAASYLDDAVTPTSTTTSISVPAPYGGLTINGLWHLNGKTVQAWLGGLDCGDYVVSNGSITVPYGDGVSAGTANGLFTAAFIATFTTFPMTVGFTYTSQGQVTRPHSREESGARTGPGFVKVRRHQWLMWQFEGTQGVSVGTTFTNLRPALFKDGGGNNLLVNQQFSGMFRDQFSDDYSFDGMVCWQVTRPYICNIAAVGGSLQTMDT